MMVPLDSFGERTLRVDCDVLNADGGTRTASISGAALAVREALKGLVSKGFISDMPEITPVAAISVGMADGKCLLDLDYKEDSSADVDANFVMTADGRLIEVQGSAEGEPFQPSDFNTMLELALQGNKAIMKLWEFSEDV